jgi:hypothetical protein
MATCWRIFGSLSRESIRPKCSVYGERWRTFAVQCRERIADRIAASYPDFPGIWLVRTISDQNQVTSHFVT